MTRRFSACIVVFSVAALFAAAGGCEWMNTDEAAPAEGKEGKQTQKTSQPAVKGEVWDVQPIPWPTIVRTQGSLVADEVAEVGVKVAGRVGQVHVDLGNTVKEGDPLVTLDENEFKLDVSRAEAQLSQARSAVGLAPDAPVESLNPENAPPVRQARAVWQEAKLKLDRAKQLRSQNATTQADLDQITASERVAEAMFASSLNSVHEKIALISVQSAELELAKQRLQDAVVKAPFDGYVQQRHVAPGAYVQVGDAIATVIGSKSLRYRGTMPERYAQRLAIGDEVRLNIQSMNEPRVSKINRISPALDSLSRALLFEAQIDNADGALRAGLFGEADVVLNPEAKAIAVPVSSVVEFAGVEKVWRVADGKLSEQAVQTGQRRGDEVEIVSGVTTGDQILRDGSTGRIGNFEPTTGAAQAAVKGESEPKSNKIEEKK